MSCVLDMFQENEEQEFQAKTSDFLYETDSPYCQMGLCGQCLPKPFQCKFSSYTVNMSGMSDDDISRAREMCRLRGTCDVEATGGEGGLIQHPIRDDVVGQAVYDKWDGGRRSQGLHEYGGHVGELTEKTSTDTNSLLFLGILVALVVFT